MRIKLLLLQKIHLNNAPQIFKWNAYYIEAYTKGKGKEAPLNALGACGERRYSSYSILTLEIDGSE
jgi:hypothetical protein